MHFHALTPPLRTTTPATKDTLNTYYATYMHGRRLPGDWTQALSYTRHKAVFCQCEDVVKRPKYERPFSTDKMDGVTMHKVCIPHRIPRAWEQQV